MISRNLFLSELSDRQLLRQAFLAVVSGADRVGVLEHDVHRDEGADEADQPAEDEPQQDRRAVFGEGQTVASGVRAQPVGHSVPPEDVVDAARANGQDNEQEQSGRVVAVSLARDVKVPGYRINVIEAEQTACDQVQQDKEQKAPVGHQGLTGLRPVHDVVEGVLKGLLRGVESLFGLAGHIRFDWGVAGRASVYAFRHFGSAFFTKHSWPPQWMKCWIVRYMNP